jgi:hypothetical protein
MLRFFSLGLLLLALSGCVVQKQPNAGAEAIAAVSYRDPGPAKFTLYTMVNNRTGAGAHTSLMINATKERIIFDPAGSFKADVVPQLNDVLYGITPAVEQAYRGAHARSTYHVVVQEIEVTAEQADIAYRLALTYGAVPGGFCASSTIKILQQVPGFEDLKWTLFPVKLANQFGEIPGVTTTRYYEDDDPDMKVGMAANNAVLNQ